MGVALGDPAREMEIETVLGYLELILLVRSVKCSKTPLWGQSDRYHSTYARCLSNPRGCCYCSMLQLGKLRLSGSVTLLPRIHSRHKVIWTQKCLTLQLHELSTTWVVPSGIIILAGLSITQSVKTTDKHPHVSHLPAAHNPVRGSWVMIIPSLRWEPGVSTRRAAT